MPLDLDSLTPEARANCAKLPEKAFAFIACHEPGNRVVAVRRGESGYFKTDLDRVGASSDEAKAMVERYNRKLGVSLEQKAALLFGSLFGFDAPGADPDRYDGERPKPRAAAAH